jgi:hypothetical protein
MARKPKNPTPAPEFDDDAADGPDAVPVLALFPTGSPRWLRATILDSNAIAASLAAAEAEVGTESIAVLGLDHTTAEALAAQVTAEELRNAIAPPLPTEPPAPPPLGVVRGSDTCESCHPRIVEGCSHCKGSGDDPDDPDRKCPRCGGLG